MNVTSLVFDPALPLTVLAGLSVLCGAVLLLALWRGLRGWGLRAVASLAVLTALAGPKLVEETRQPLGDIIVVIEDDSASSGLPGRAAQIDAARAQLVQGFGAQAVGQSGVDLVYHRLSELMPPDPPSASNARSDPGTRLISATRKALGRLPAERVAGVFLMSDGVVHDADQALPLEAPLHLMMTGSAADWDYRLHLIEAPAFGILDETVTLRVMVEALGPVPDAPAFVDLTLRVDGGAPRRMAVPVGVETPLSLRLEHAGRTLVHLSLPPKPEELTARNNDAVAQINGVRDRLRVLLVSGMPHPGTRGWRNLLKSDGAVDLVHFTILRPPEKQDGVPVNELSLIAFPTQELFIDKIDEFDLIIFDRYRLRGILPGVYLDNVRAYVERGGAVLVAAGPALASADSIARSDLAAILPARPTGRLIEAPFRPEISAIGQRHPVTRALRADWLADQGKDPSAPWGAWMRRVELSPLSGHKVLQAPDGAPLLSLDRVGEGRVALLASDQAWLWARGFDGGGPQAQLMRRLSHWLMREPDLEEDALTTRAIPGGFEVLRQSLEDDPGVLDITAPDGTLRQIELTETAPGRFSARIDTDQQGLFHLSQGALSAVAMRGQATPREFERPLASANSLAPYLERGADRTGGPGGGVWSLEAGVPSLRAVRAGRATHGNGWLGYMPRGAYRTLDVTRVPLAPAWLYLCLAGLALCLAWWLEGRGRRGVAPEERA
ncbi:hypothetical protein [Aliiroseovarius marinus]|uniref:hypothetical protein n=1 Tax=Aliiroseovarius marinus TaxID=2500159 RepID=UPI003D7E4573